MDIRIATMGMANHLMKGYVNIICLCDFSSPDDLHTVAVMEEVLQVLRVLLRRRLHRHLDLQLARQADTEELEGAEQLETKRAQHDIFFFFLVL
jgi:hypothetical protein